MPKMLPVTFTWANGMMTPNARFVALCGRQFDEGEEYVLEVLERGSSKSRGHFFASINEAWHNLPDDVAKRFPTSEHLRKWAMIQCGYAHETALPCPSADMAARVAAFTRQADAYCVIRIDPESHVVHRFSAMSIRKMKREIFQKMKTEVLDLVSSMIQTRRTDLERAGKHGANR